MLPLEEETLFDVLSVSLLDHELLLHEFDIIVNLFNLLLSLLRIIRVGLCDMIEPQRCVPYLVKPHLELLDLCISYGFLFLDITRINFQLFYVCLNFFCVIL